MTEFKQIIGRGTRVREDYGKLYFNIMDYTGSATRQSSRIPTFSTASRLPTRNAPRASGEVGQRVGRRPKPQPTYSQPQRAEVLRRRRPGEDCRRTSSTSSTRRAGSSGWSSTPTYTAGKGAHSYRSADELDGQWADPSGAEDGLHQRLAENGHHLQSSRKPDGEARSRSLRPPLSPRLQYAAPYPAEASRAARARQRRVLRQYRSGGARKSSMPSSTSTPTSARSSS